MARTGKVGRFPGGSAPRRPTSPHAQSPPREHARRHRPRRHEDPGRDRRRGRPRARRGAARDPDGGRPANDRRRARREPARVGACRRRRDAEARRRRHSRFRGRAARDGHRRAQPLGPSGVGAGSPRCSAEGWARRSCWATTSASRSTRRPRSAPVPMSRRVPRGLVGHRHRGQGRLRRQALARARRRERDRSRRDRDGRPPLPVWPRRLRRGLRRTGARWRNARATRTARPQDEALQDRRQEGPRTADERCVGQGARGGRRTRPRADRPRRARDRRRRGIGGEPARRRDRRDQRRTRDAARRTVRREDRPRWPCRLASLRASRRGAAPVEARRSSPARSGGVPLDRGTSARSTSGTLRSRHARQSSSPTATATSPTRRPSSPRAFCEVMAKRRTVREFSDRPCRSPRSSGSRALRRRRPSGANKQPERFVAVRDPAVKRAIRAAAEKEEREFYAHRATAEWLADLAPLGTDASKPFLEVAPWLVVVFRLTRGDGDSQHYYVNESVGIAWSASVLAAAHHAGLATLTHTPSPMGFLQEVLGQAEAREAVRADPGGLPGRRLPRAGGALQAVGGDPDRDLTRVARPTQASHEY